MWHNINRAARNGGRDPQRRGKSMKQRRTAVFVVGMALVGMLLGGCASTLQSRKIDKENLQTTVLVDPSVLEKGKEGEALYRYINPKVDWKNYTKIILDPVVVYQEAALDAETRDNYQKLANNAYAYLTKDLEKDHTIVTTPGPDTLRLQLAIVSAEKSAPVRNFLTTVVPIGMAVSAVKYGATGTPMAVGEITAEMRATDSMTGELLAAALDKRVGGKQLRNVFRGSWQDADSGLKYWAELTRYRLCTLQGGADCEKLKP
jgi:hypothetical protein